MSWLIRIRCADQDGMLVEERETERSLVSDLLHIMLIGNHIDDYDPSELVRDCFDCRNSSTDTDYVVSVFEAGKPDPYDALHDALHKDYIKELQKKGLFYDGYEEYQKHKAGTMRKIAGPTCTCELIF